MASDSFAQGFIWTPIPMTTYETCSLLLQISALLAAMMVAAIYYRQLNEMRKQFQAMDQSRRWQTDVDILKWLDDVYDDVDVVLSLEKVDYSSWSENHRIVARNVCYRFHVIGSLLSRHGSDQSVVANAWFYSVPKCRDVLDPYLKEIRDKRDPGSERYFSGFDRLVSNFDKINKNYKGMISIVPEADR